MIRYEVKNLLKTGFALIGILTLFINTVHGYDSPTKTRKAPWPENWESNLAEAKKEGKVTIYGHVGPQLRIALTKAIKDELGLDLELVPGKGKEVLTRFATEMHAGLPSADILLGGAPALRTTPLMYDFWEKLEPLLILPEVLDTKVWPNGRLPFLDSQKKLIPLALEMDQFLVANTDMVKPGQIKSYRDLLLPQWKGKMVMFDPTVTGTAQTWTQLITTKAYGPAEGEAFLRRFAGQGPLITRDSRLQMEWVARGRYPLAIGVDTQVAYNLRKNGAPIARIAAEEGSVLTGTGSYIVLPVKRPHPKAAVAVLNWLLSARGEEVYCQAYGGMAARLDVKIAGISNMALPMPGEKVYVQDEETILNTDKALVLARRIFGPLLK